MNADQLIQMVTDRALRKWQTVHPEATELPPSIESGDDFDPVRATCWFIATQEAKAVFDSWTVEDLAGLFMDGTAPIGGPYAKMAIQDWLDTWVDDFEEMAGQRDAQPAHMVAELDKLISAHFGLQVPDFSGR